MGSKQGRMQSGKCNLQAVKGAGEIGRPLTERYSSSVYLSDRERDTLRRAAGTKNLSKAVQYAAKVLGDIRK